MLRFRGDLEGHDGQRSVNQSDSEADEQPADEGYPHGDRGEQERADGDRSDRHECAADDREPAAQVRIVNARLADCANRPGDRTESDPPGGGCLGPAVHTLEDERNHDGETDL